MKKIIMAFVCLMTIGIVMSSCDNKHKELFTITDSVVESLYDTYESYGLLGGTEKYTSDREYKVFPIGRLVNVRIEHYASKDEYENLRMAIEKHYKNNNKVRDVYICGGGTIMIDCRY
jgi:hypothetical protein